MRAVPRFLQAVRPFAGAGLDDHRPLEPRLAYRVPSGAQAQCAYLRAGSTADQLVCVVLLRDGEPMRLFPVGAGQAIHVPLRITEDLLEDTTLEVAVSAPEGTTGTIVVDLGILEL